MTCWNCSPRSPNRAGSMADSKQVAAKHQQSLQLVSHVVFAFGRNRHNVLEACFFCDACDYIYICFCVLLAFVVICEISFEVWSKVHSIPNWMKLHGVATLHKVKSSWKCFRGPFCAFWFQTESTAWFSVSSVHGLVGVQAYCKRMEGQSKWNNAAMLCPIMLSGFRHWDIVTSLFFISSQPFLDDFDLQ